MQLHPQTGYSCSRVVTSALLVTAIALGALLLPASPAAPSSAPARLASGESVDHSASTVDGVALVDDLRRADVGLASSDATADGWCQHTQDQTTVPYFTPCATNERQRAIAWGSCAGSTAGSHNKVTASPGTADYAFGWFPAARRLDRATEVFLAAFDDRGAASVNPAPWTLRVNLTKRGVRFPIPARFDLENVCVSGRGGGLYTIDPLVDNTLSSPSAEPVAVRLDGLEDERRAPVRGELYIRDARDVDRDVGSPSRRVYRNASEPLIIHPLLSQSDNFGHVMFRVMALRRTLREVAKQRIQQRPVVLYYATGAGAASVTQRHMYGAFAGLINTTRILAATSPGSLAPHPSQQTAADVAAVDDVLAPRPYRFQRRLRRRRGDEMLKEAPDVCFERAVLAWPPVDAERDVGFRAHQNDTSAAAAVKASRRSRRPCTAARW